MKSNGNSAISRFCDADWASSSDRHSISGYIFQMNETGGYVSWKSKKQKTIALSTCEAEYMALALCVQEAKYLVQMYNDLYDIICVPVIIGVDNQGTILPAKNPVMHQRTKHISVKYHFVREEVIRKNVELYYVESKYNVTDLLTKSQSSNRIEQLLKFRDWKD